jgi:hypothetical protein
MKSTEAGDLVFGSVAAMNYATLECMNFSRCSPLTDDSILALAGIHTPQLVALFEENSVQITVPALPCLNLVKLDISWSLVSNAGITLLLKACIRLESLCLQGCKSITEEVCPEFGNAGSLLTLDLGWVDGMPETAAQEIVKQRRHRGLRGPFKVFDYYGEKHELLHG